MTELSLRRHFCCENREAQVSWVTDIIRMKVRPALVRALAEASLMSRTSGEGGREGPLALKTHQHHPSPPHLERIVFPIRYRQKRGALCRASSSSRFPWCSSPGGGTYRLRNVKFSRSLGANINHLGWKSCENEAKATTTITLLRLALRYGEELLRSVSGAAHAM